MKPPSRSSGPGRHAKVFLLTSPCPKAAVDIEKLSYLIRTRGFEIAERPEDATVIVTWGCGFVDDAKQESIEDILAAVEVKKGGSARAVIVTGCLPEKYGDDLAESLPEVDTFVGASSLALLPEIIDYVLAGEEVRRVWLSRPFMEFDPGCERDLGGDVEWTRTLLICRGCDNRCTYCTIPQMRGSLRSREPDQIIKEARGLVRGGAVEIVLAGQDIASYGRDLGGPDLPGLVERLGRESGAHWIRLCYAHPDNLDPGIADIMAANPSICRYIDLPIQHAAPAVLKAMGRNPDPDAIREKVARMRDRVPDLAIRTSVIVGFPGEREADFEFLLKFLKEVEFDLIGAFEFSPQPQTVAGSLPGAVPDFIRQERLIEVVRLQEEISEARVAKLMGEEIEVLVEEVTEAGGVVGRSQYDAPDVDRRVHVAGSTADPGEFVMAAVTGYTSWGHIEARVLKR
jgi:ribosomal protein S12 methylthiotransferase